MFNILLILLGLLVSPANAQNITCATRPNNDSSNACASTAFVHNLFSSGMITIANNNTELAAISTAISPAIIRYGYSAAGDSPMVLFVASNSACTLNAGAGDGGSQVPSANGKCWLGMYGGEYNVKQFGAKGNGITDDSTAIQNTLTAAGVAGGGHVFVPAGTYKTTIVLSVPSYTTFFGVGKGGSIIRPATILPSKTICGTGVNAVIASVCTVAAKVSRLTVDLRTNSVVTDGIEFGEYLAAGATTDSVAEENEILGFDAHQYLIYVKFADRVKIKNNRGEGILVGAATQDVACIELFGSNSSEVSGNTCRGVGVGVTVKSQVGVTGSNIQNILVHDNVIDYAQNGIVLSNDTGGFIFKNVQVYNNIITNSSNNSIQASFSGTSTTANIQIINNQLLESDLLNFRLVGAVTQDMNIYVAGNNIVQSNPLNGAVFVSEVNGLHFSNNTIGALPHRGIEITGGTAQTYIGNKFRGTQSNGIYITAGTTTPSYMQIIGNSFENYGIGVSSPGILVDSGTYLTIDRNHFMYGAASSGAYAVDAQNATYTEVSNNNIGWATNNATFINGTNGRNNYNTAIYDRNAYRLSAIFPREVGFGLSNTDILTDDVDTSGTLRLRNSVTPATSTSSCSQGQWRWDASYIYICIGTNTWARAAITTW